MRWLVSRFSIVRKGFGLTTILDRIVATKRDEIRAARARRSEADLRRDAELAEPPRDFLGALRRADSIGLIAEIKKASPSKGIIRADFDPERIAIAYRDGGADCLSVLTDESYFQGHLDYLNRVRGVVPLPLLRKDFIVDPYQVHQARAAGADAVLLIAECLEPVLLAELHAAIRDYGMTALVELHEPEQLDKVLACGPELVGINNRDLKTFRVDLDHAIGMRERIPREILVVGESGIRTTDDVRRLIAGGIGAMLVGESLMRSEDPAAATRELLGRG